MNKTVEGLSTLVTTSLGIGGFSLSSKKTQKESQQLLALAKHAV